MLDTKEGSRVMDESTAELVKNVRNSCVFVCPFSYENEPDMILHPDPFLHGGEMEKYILDNGGRIYCDDLPSVYKFSESASLMPMHFQTIKSSDGAKRYMALFDNFHVMIRIFGIRIRVGLICYTTAEQFCRFENLDGIVIGPGTRNVIISANDL